MRRHHRRIVLACLGLVMAMGARAATEEYIIEIRDHLFYPSMLTIPAGVKVKLRIINHDPTPEEFESFELNREKVILGNRSGIVFIGPLNPGEYPFFGEFYAKTAQGVIIATDEPESAEP